MKKKGASSLNKANLLANFKVGTVFLVFIMNCTHSPNQMPLRVMKEPDCLVTITAQIETAPKKNWIETLDGQKVNVNHFINYCTQHFPYCILYEKFYYWKRDIKKMVSTNNSGVVSHIVRVYYNPLSICFPSKVHPGRTHGDVAEFYDENGNFMGIAVYMGEGKYFSIPFSGYTIKHD